LIGRPVKEKIISAGAHLSSKQVCTLFFSKTKQYLTNIGDNGKKLVIVL